MPNPPFKIIEFKTPQTKPIKNNNNQDPRRRTKGSTLQIQQYINNGKKDIERRKSLYHEFQKSNLRNSS